MTIIESLKKYLNRYAPLAKSRLNVDFLPAEANSYSIEPVATSPVVKRYADGSTIRQFLFVLASREPFGAHLRQQIDNLSFYEEFEAWLEEKNEAGDFPELSGGREVRSMETVTSGYAFVPGTDTARYQIQCRLKYYQPKKGA